MYELSGCVDLMNQVTAIAKSHSSHQVVRLMGDYLTVFGAVAIYGYL